MTLIREFHTPFDVLVRNFFNNDFGFSPAGEVKIGHPVDIYENKEGLHIEVACTGLSKDDVNIDIEGDILRISYDKTNDDKCCEVNDCTYLHRGIAKRSFNLGYKIAQRFDLGVAEAKMENGLLTIHIPFTKESKPKSLKIK